MHLIHPVFHVSRLLPYIPNDVAEFPHRPLPTRPSPVAHDESNPRAWYYEDHIINGRVNMQDLRYPKLEFLVRWSEPYTDPCHDKWLPLANVRRLDVFRDSLRRINIRPYLTSLILLCLHAAGHAHYHKHIYSSLLDSVFHLYIQYLGFSSFMPILFFIFLFYIDTSGRCVLGGGSVMYI